MSSYEALFAEAARLPVAERIQLIEALWNTVPEESLPELSDEWLTEIERRSAEFDAGSTATVPWEEIRSDALRRLSNKTN